MVGVRPSDAPRPGWWMGTHVATALGLLAPLIATFFTLPWWGWALITVGLLATIAATQWQLGSLDANTGRGHLLLTTLRIVTAASMLCTLSQLHIVFITLFVVLPLVVAPLVSASLRLYALLLVGIVALLPVGLSHIPIWIACVLWGLTLTSAAFAWWVAKRSDSSILSTASVPLPLAAPTTLLADAFVDTHVAAQRQREHLHRLLCMIRAAVRGQFAGIFWFDEAQNQFAPAFFEIDAASRLNPHVFSASTLREHQGADAHGLWQYTASATAPWYTTHDAHTPQTLISNIEDEGILLGILVLERNAAHGEFGRADQVAAQECAHLIHQHLRDEQAAAAAFRASHDLQAVALAAEKLSNTLDEQEVYRIGEKLFQQLLPHVEVAFWRRTDDGLTLSFVSEPWTGFTVGDTLRRDGNLIEKAIERRHVLPYKNEGEPEAPPLFGHMHPASNLDRYLVCPLVTGRMAHSAVVLKMPVSGAFTAVVRTRIGLIANQIAAAQQIALAYAKMTKRATHDSMTSLLNRATFHEQASRAFERAERGITNIVAIMLDIDHFKNINDTYGHAVGDDVIRGVATIIREEVRRIDIAARYGGEEFVIVMENTDLPGAQQFAERLRTRIAQQRYMSQHGDFNCTISLGVAQYPSDGHDIESLVQCADEALYQSKRNGRNRVSVYDAPA